MGIRVIAMKAAYIAVLRASTNTDIMPLITTDILYHFRLDLNYSGLYYYTQDL